MLKSIVSVRSSLSVTVTVTAHSAAASCESPAAAAPSATLRTVMAPVDGCTSNGRAAAGTPLPARGAMEKVRVSLASWSVAPMLPTAVPAAEFSSTAMPPPVAPAAIDSTGLSGTSVTVMVITAVVLSPVGSPSSRVSTVTDTEGVVSWSSENPGRSDSAPAPPACRLNTGRRASGLTARIEWDSVWSSFGSVAPSDASSTEPPAVLSGTEMVVGRTPL
mmetsp:Transcript_16812/g.63753  ORF Transcript_16812/g.63753 Transcript_16812/m.63753 type:complete len:219 (+) Transcript_16812:1357-2013(+)